MSTSANDPIIGIAATVAYCFSRDGYAFIEDEHLEALADTLKSFLKTAGISVNDDLDRTGPRIAANGSRSDHPT